MLLGPLRLARKNEPKKFGNGAGPSKHGGGDIWIGDQVGEGSGRLGLRAVPVPLHRHGLEQPIDDGSAAGPDNGGPAALICRGDVREQSRNPEPESGADLVIGRR